MPSNQNLPVRLYTKQYSRILGTVFNVRKAFGGAFAPIQILDGIQQNAKAFSVKTCNTPVVIGTYNTGANVAFGTGTANSSRFGPMTEVIYADTDVEYSYTLAIHEGLDRFTVNNDLNAAVADRLKLQSEAQTRGMNIRHGEFISASAGKVVSLASMSDEDILALFNAMSTYYTDLEVDVPVTAYVTPELFNAIVDLVLTTTAKHSGANIDKNTISEFKGFTIKKEASKYFAEGDIAYFSPDGVFIPFVGIQTARTIESTNFDGVELQAAAKGGQYILDDNKAAVAKVTYTASDEGGNETPDPNGGAGGGA